MRVFADKLSDNLKRQLHNIYLIFGNEPLLLQESRDAVLATAKAAGYGEKHHFVVDQQLNWNEVFNCCQALSLFSSQQVIELEIPETGLNAAASKELLELSKTINQDIVLLILGGKLTKQQENAKWFKTLNQAGVWVSCLTPDLQRLPQFVQARCRALNLKPDAEALQMLAQWHEGNLLALVQNLEKLTLLYPDGELNLIRVEEALSRHNHYTPFHWMDTLLGAKPNRAQRILRQLELEGVEPIILLRTLQRELGFISKLKAELNNTSIGAVFDKHRVWQSKRPLYSATLQRLSPQQIRTIYKQLAEAEVMSKTQYDNSIWPLLAQISLEFCSASPTVFADLPFSKQRML